jgi:adenylosuccinate synthase
MRHARVVIGSNFGDEGKGLMTDYFTRQAGGDGVLVVRFNGGAQAGHTVVAPDGRRHVFSHVGAGSLAGADTLLARRFIANPMLFASEREELAAMDVTPRVFVDPRCLLTTPFDMILNEMVETARGAARHGSVGLGINETVTRSDHPRFRLTVGDAIAFPAAVADHLRRIQAEWVPQRVADLGLQREYECRRDLLGRDSLIDHWAHLLVAFLDSVTVSPDSDVLATYNQVVFEGAQGLALDETRGQFPHVTRSRTGIRNVAEILRGMPPTEVAVTYATRAYLTRHGAGPLDGELPGVPFPGVYDHTNVPHEFQGTLRYALLDVDRLRRRIQDDFVDAACLALSHAVRLDLAITCLDQLPADAAWSDGGNPTSGTHAELIHAAGGGLAGRVFAARGPTAHDVEVVSSD